MVTDADLESPLSQLNPGGRNLNLSMVVESLLTPFRDRCRCACSRERRFDATREWPARWSVSRSGFNVSQANGKNIFVE
jgi:hypothetical protein